MKKTLSVIALMLAITIMFSINAYAFAIPSYQDIDGYSWASEAIYRMYRDRIMLGWSSEQFAPEGSVTVAEFATTAYRMAGCPAVPEKSDKYDIVSGNKSESYWANDTITWAVQNGVIETAYLVVAEVIFGESHNGYHFSNHRFAIYPDSFETTAFGFMKLTRREIVLGLYFFAEYMNANREDIADISGFSDCADLKGKMNPISNYMSYDYIDNRANEYVNLDPVDVFGWAVVAGIIKGYDDNTLRPNEYVTRAEYAVMLERFLGYIGK